MTFRVGDIVTCIEGTHMYTYTRPGILCKVIKVSGSNIDVETLEGEQEGSRFNVLAENFELVLDNTQEYSEGEWV